METLNPNEDFERHQSELLATALEREEAELLASARQEEIDLTPPERVRRLLFSLVIECVPL